MGLVTNYDTTILRQCKKPTSWRKLRRDGARTVKGRRSYPNPTQKGVCVAVMPVPKKAFPNLCVVFTAVNGEVMFRKVCYDETERDRTIYYQAGTWVGVNAAN